MMKVILYLTIAVVAAVPALAESAELEDDLRSYLLEQNEAWNRGDVGSIDLGWSRGFGFRTAGARTGNMPSELARKGLQTWFDTMERYTVESKELNISIVGDVALVWGVHIEDFKVKGLPPERVTVRSSGTYRRTADGSWEALMGHRDIQPFSEDGQYLRAQSCEPGHSP